MAYIYCVDCVKKHHQKKEELYFSSFAKCEKYIQDFADAFDTMCKVNHEHIHKEEYNRTLISRYQLIGMDTEVTYVDFTISILNVH